ncbi:MAG TPA: hypothetical protein VIF62_25185 [Labilithrix sp.]
MRASSFAVLVACALVAPRVLADEADRPLAQQLFDDARALLEKGNYAEACPKFAESQRLDPGGGTLLNLAWCHELQGRTATAWSEFHDALAQAERDARQDREDFARQHIKDLEPKLVRIDVQVPPEVAARNPDVMLDRSRLPSAAWGTAVPVDPGEHRVTVEANGVAPFAVTVDANKPGTTFPVVVPSLPELVAPVPVVESRRSTEFWIVLGGAGALAATSVVTGLVALNANAYVKDNCDSARDFCRVSDASDAATRAKTFAWVSTITLGAALAAVGVAFLLPRDRVTVGVASTR